MAGLGQQGSHQAGLGSDTSLALQSVSSLVVIPESSDSPHTPLVGALGEPQVLGRTWDTGRGRILRGERPGKGDHCRFPRAFILCVGASSHVGSQGGQGSFLPGGSPPARSHLAFAWHLLIGLNTWDSARI